MIYFKPITNISHCRILISNDDGVDAYGIKLLEEILAKMTDDVWVVAPQSEKSGVSHAITSNKWRSAMGHSCNTETNQDIIKVSDKHYAIDGTPSDCIRTALNKIMPDSYPDLIISGINNGRNIADDITYSGTVGASIEGILYGIPSIAISQLVEKGKDTNWEIVRQYLPEIISKVCQGTYSANTLININFPNIESQHLKGIEICSHGSRRFKEGTIEYEKCNKTSFIEKETQKRNGYRADHLAINDHITISALKIDLSDYEGLEELGKIFKNKD